MSKIVPIASVCPEPGQSIDWGRIDAAYPWFAALKGSTQDPIHHMEGDVHNHVRDVGDYLVGQADWRNACPNDRLSVFAAMLLHDVAKPQTRIDHGNGRISNPHHSRIGALEARRILWELNFDPILREQVCGMIAAHQIPFWLYEKEEYDIHRFVRQISLITSNKLLAILADADANGRYCADKATIVTAVDLFRDLAQQAGCFDGPFPFHNAETRVRHYADQFTISAEAQLYDATSSDFEMVILSGLPGSGKSTWVRNHANNRPVVSLDGLRAEMGVRHTDNQGTVVQASREAARVHLRAKQSFIWDATNLTPLTRSNLTQLARQYGARIRMVQIEANHIDTIARNRARDARAMVPDAVMNRMIAKWEPPTLCECHTLERWSDGRLIATQS